MARILVIDDDKHVLKALLALLAFEGYEGIGATDGKEGIKLYRERPADLVVTDIMLPCSNGIAVIEKLRMSYPDARILAMTGGTVEEHNDMLRMAQILGATDVLRKPLDNEVFLRCVHNALAG